jgi:glycosyltransferase involved in cell wall biosynthesis
VAASRVDRVAVVIPAKDCGSALTAVLGALPTGLAVYVVDDGSAPPVEARGVTVLRHPANRGYGAAQKTGYAAALADGHERVVLLHGDGQYHLDDTLGLASALDDADAALGSRFLADPSVIPGWRRWGNRALTGLANVRFQQHFSELHTGARAFRADALRAVPLAAFSDDYLFDQQLLVALLRQGRRIVERPARVRYDDEVQSIPFRRAVAYAAGCVGVILRG